ncbi:MAG: DUF3786 domain-containing protein [Deltaproteobacteria bacterium]|nr:DUF3786 domain-containing protein [Deltaproteobacteria bacterium]MBW2128262.1 DUF3786 domain-containing protein [Deltaproteobacteria bacterium]
METNYDTLIRNNLERIYREPEGLDKKIPALRRGRQFLFRAFGRDCCLSPEGVTFSEKADTGPRALLVTLYALHVVQDPLRLAPFVSFKDLPDSMPYHGAFSANTERVLVPRVPEILERTEEILKAFEGEKDPPGGSGDLSLLLYPLPKIALLYIIYLADEEFPASVTCLFSANARIFMPLDGLADVAEYTSREIIRLCRGV